MALPPLLAARRRPNGAAASSLRASGSAATAGSPDGISPSPRRRPGGEATSPLRKRQRSKRRNDALSLRWAALPWPGRRGNAPPPAPRVAGLAPVTAPSLLLGRQRRRRGGPGIPPPWIPRRSHNDVWVFKKGCQNFRNPFLGIRNPFLRIRNIFSYNRLQIPYNALRIPYLGVRILTSLYIIHFFQIPNPILQYKKLPYLRSQKDIDP